MGAKTGNKAGRPLKQNGKNKVPEKEEPPQGPDLSVLRKPVEISVTGLSDVLKVFQNSPPELHHLMSYECDVVYECKVCRNLFRSLANFISHKRVYCTQLQGSNQNNFFKLNKKVNDSTVIVEPENVRTTRSREHWRTSDAAGINDSRETYEPKTRNGQAEPAPFRITIKKDLTSIVEKLMQKNSTQSFSESVGRTSSSSEYYDNLSKELMERKKGAQQQAIHLQSIDNTSCGVFQTVVYPSGTQTELIKSQVQDLNRIISDTEAVLGPDGRVIENGVPQSSAVLLDDRRRRMKILDGEDYHGPPVTAPESEVELYCNLCKEHFSTFKMLNHHMRSLHMTSRTFYPCPCCKLPLSNSWSVYRHLLKVHRKTNEQIRKLREKVIKRSFRREVLQSGAQKLSKPNVSENPLCPSELIYDTTQKTLSNEDDSYEQWFGNHEDGLGQSCGGCGKRFDRRAALLAHSQSCMKSSSLKHNSSGPTRPPVQAEKSTSVSRSTPPIKPSAVTSSTLNPISPVISVLRSSAPIPVHPLHFSQEQQAVPTKKIEIQIRRDYGKTPAASSECRTRTPSISRSEDGASVGRSEDGTTSGSSETEASSLTEKRLDLKKKTVLEADEMANNFDDRQGRQPSLQSETISKSAYEPPTKRRVGRPRKKRPEIVHFNGTNNSQSVPVSVSEGSDDSIHSSVSKIEDSRKRKCDEDRSENDIKAVLSSSKKLFQSKVNRQSKKRHTSSPSTSSKMKISCLMCHQKFISGKDLRSHLFNEHLNYNRFRCLICNFRTFSKFDCISHVLRTHLDPWDKDKCAALALVQDIQMDAGGSTDIHPTKSRVDSGDSESALSDPGTPLETPEKSEDSSPEDLPNMAESGHDGHSLEGVGEILSVA